jgi:hypothetical protein
MARMLSRAQLSQMCTRLPFSTEQVQVTGGIGPAVVAPQRAHTTVWFSAPC